MSFNMKLLLSDGRIVMSTWAVYTFLHLRHANSWMDNSEFLRGISPVLFYVSLTIAPGVLAVSTWTARLKNFHRKLGAIQVVTANMFSI